MKWLISLSVVFITLSANALTLDEYLSAVKANNPEARALIASIEAAEVKLNRADLGVMPEAYGSYTLFDDRTPPLNPGFSPSKRDGYSWKVGVQQQSTLGLSGNLYFENNQIALGGVSPTFFPINDYVNNRGVLELKQSLWRNGFGGQTRAELKAAKAGAQAELYNQQFKLKNLLLDAENAYWSLVTYNQIVGLQQENVERSKKLYERMAKQVRARLFDDVEGLSSQAAYESRELELQTSTNDRANLARVFNTLRGLDSDVVEKLQDLPELEAQATYKKSQFKMRREDFLALKEMAKVAENQAKSARSSYKAQVDLVGTVASNGLNPQFAGAYDQVKGWDHPSWSVGIQVKFPLNFSLNNKLYNAAKKDIQAGRDNSDNADFQMMRTWEEISQRQKEMQEIYNKARRIEKSLTALMAKERTRLNNGRTTTFQLLTYEQNLVGAQIQRTRAQLGLIQIKNLLKTFEASNESI